MNIEQPKEEEHQPKLVPRESNPEIFQSLPPQIHQTQLQKHIDKINKFTTKVVGPTRTIIGLIIRINNYTRFQPPYEFHTSSLGRRIVETHQYFIDSIYFHLCNLSPIPKPRGYRQPSPPLTQASLSMIELFLRRSWSVHIGRRSQCARVVGVFRTWVRTTEGKRGTLHSY